MVVTTALLSVVAATGAACAVPATATASAGSSPSSGAVASSTAPSPSRSSPAATTVPSSPTTLASPTAATTATPTELGGATCYFSAAVDGPDNSVGIAFAYKEGEGYDNTVSVSMLMDACHQSLVMRGAIKEADAVAACVIADGTVGVFPGVDDVCAALGLPVAARDASAPIPR